MATLDNRSYELGDEHKILDLFRLCFPGHAVNDAGWVWRFRNNPSGLAVIELSWAGDTLAAHYAVSPTFTRINGCDCLTGLSLDTMTHTDYRGHRIFPLLAQNAYARMSDMCAAVIWGFPNSFSHRGFVRDLAWTDVYEIPMMRMQLAQELHFPTATDRIVELRAFDSRFDQFWERVKDDYSIINRRDQNYLQWRYINCPRDQYHVLAYIEGEVILGYAVFKRYRNEVQIVDILADRDDHHVGMELISRVVQAATAESAMSLSLWLNVSHPLHHELEKYGFQNGEPVTYFGMCVLQSELGNTGIHDFHNWYLTMGDSDVF